MVFHLGATSGFPDAACSSWIMAPGDGGKSNHLFPGVAIFRKINSATVLWNYPHPGTSPIAIASAGCPAGAGYITLPAGGVLPSEGPADAPF